MISIQSAVEHRRRLMAAACGVDEIAAEPYYDGPLHSAPDNSQVTVADRFTVRIGRERRFFITPVEWEPVRADSLSGVLAEILHGSGPRYRVKDQREYVMRMLRECKDELSERKIDD